MHKTILDTQRLTLREFNLQDTAFILELVNTPDWLKFIGDRGIKNLKDAENYLKNGPLKSYQENGFGLWMVQLKDSQKPIGMCGLLKRDSLAHVDIGFAMLPEHSAKGYGYEIASATMLHAKNQLNIRKIIAITDPQNTASIALLNKIGLTFEKTYKSSENETLLILSEPEISTDLDQLNKITHSFFNSFTNTNNQTPQVEKIRDLFIQQGNVIKNTNGTPEIYNLDQFITPRIKILSDGTLTDFSEREIHHQTEIYGHIAHRFSFYGKSGKLNNHPFETYGMKTIQFTKINQEWKISSVAWSDEPAEN